MRTGIKGQSGLTLIELLIAALIGMIILGVVMSIYMANRSIYRFQESYARVQETGRYVSGVLGKDIRNASYTDCGNLTTVKNVLTNSYVQGANVFQGVAAGRAALWWLNTNRMISGYEQGQAKPAEILGAVADSDILVVTYRATAGEGVISNHNTGSNKFVLTANHTFTKGNVLMASDCSSASVFRMSGPPGAAGVTTDVEYNSGVLGGGMDNDLTGTPNFSMSKLQGGFVAPLIVNVYYVMMSDDPAFATNPCPSSDPGYVRRVLAVMTLAGSVDGRLLPPQAVACDVHSMQLRYSLDINGDVSADGFVKANDALLTTSPDAEKNWRQVLGVKVDFLVVNPKPNTSKETVVYCLDYNGGGNPALCSAASTAHDYKWTSQASNGLRSAKVFSTVYNFRNRTS